MKSPDVLRRNRTEPVLSGLIDLNRIVQQNQTEPVSSGLVNQFDLNQITLQTQTEPVQTRMGVEDQTQAYPNRSKPVEASNQSGAVLTRMPNQYQNGYDQYQNDPIQTRTSNQPQNGTGQYQKDPIQTRSLNQQPNVGNNFANQNRNEPVQFNKNFGLPNAAEKDNSGDEGIVSKPMENRYS